LVEIDEFGSFIDPPFQHVFRFELGKFTRDESQHHALVFRYQAQRFEGSRSRRIVFEEIRVDVDLVEQRIRDEIVAALRAPMTLIVAAADVHREMKRRGPSGKRAVHHNRVSLEQEFLRVVTALAHRFPNSAVAQRSQRGLVDLHIAASRVGQHLQLAIERVDDVLPEKFEIGICFLADILTARTKVNDSR
jgi:hypothetical protein